MKAKETAMSEIDTHADLRAEVRARYGAIAASVTQSSCGSGPCCGGADDPMG